MEFIKLMNFIAYLRWIRKQKIQIICFLDPILEVTAFFNVKDFCHVFKYYLNESIFLPIMSCNYNTVTILYSLLLVIISIISII